MRQQIAAEQALITSDGAQKTANKHFMADHPVSTRRDDADIGHIESELTRSCWRVYYLSLDHIEPEIVQNLHGNAGGSRAGINQQFHVS